MTTILYIEINIVSIVILFLLLNNMQQYMAKSRTHDQTIFHWYIIVLICVLVADSGMWYFDGKHTLLSMGLNIISTALYYILNPLIGFIWLLYTDFQVFQSKAGLLKRIYLYSIPTIISAGLSIASVWTGWLFGFDSLDKYFRGPYFMLMAFAALLPLIVSFAIAIWNIKKNGGIENRKINFYLVSFPIMMLGVSAIQIIFFGISIIWVGCMLLVVNIYINIQNAEISTDHLTGLLNRRQIVEHFNHKRNFLEKNRIIFAVMIDLDEFKSINDTYGHQTGDRVLINFAEILRKSCRGTDDFIFRMGGDEYLIMGEMFQEKEVSLLLERIKKHVEEYNKENLSKHQISFSMGSAVLREEDTFEDFIAAADKEMYEQKNKNKKLRQS